MCRFARAKTCFGIVWRSGQGTFPADPDDGRLKDVATYRVDRIEQIDKTWRVHVTRAAADGTEIPKTLPEDVG